MSLAGLKYYFSNPKKIYKFLAGKGLLNWMSDKTFLKMSYRINMGKKLDLENPKTFNEKLQWLKLYDRKPIYTTMVDKYEVKKYVANLIGEEYIIPTLGVWDRFEDIDFDALPNQFVLKCTHDSGGLVICKDKSQLDIKYAKSKINKCLKRNFYWLGREWPYKNVKPRIIAEKLIQDSTCETMELTDYKFYCFNGEPKFMYISKDVAKDPKTDFFDMEYNRLDMRMRDPNSDVPPSKPICFEKMIEISKILSKNIPHLRVDFYFSNKNIYVGELTFFHCGGFVSIKPDSWNKIIGGWLKLPDNDKVK